MQYSGEIICCRIPELKNNTEYDFDLIASGFGRHFEIKKSKGWKECRKKIKLKIPLSLYSINSF
jgi:hypothetical protein